MKGGRSACRVELTEPAHGLAGGQRLHGHTSLLQLLDRVGIGPHPAVGARTHDQVRRELVQHVGEVVEYQRVTLLAPPVPHHPVGQDDEGPGLLASVDDDPPRTRSGRSAPSYHLGEVWLPAAPM